MTSSHRLDLEPAAVAGGAAAERAPCLFHPYVDFVGLGGGSLILMAAAAMVVPIDAPSPVIAMTMLLLANVINHPHFANSYQIFYRNFQRKLFGGVYQRGMRIRYVLAGLVVPAALILVFAVCVAAGDAATLAYSFNFMVFLTGWHYVRQGYGILIVESVLKRRFFGEWEKKILLLNGYFGWITAWVNANQLIARRDYFGLSYYTFNIPDVFLYGFAGATLLTTVLVLYIFFRKWRRDRENFPINGVLGYLASIYVWVLMRVNLLFILIIPVFHSLQYLIVVWRYQLNYVSGEVEAAPAPAAAAPWSRPLSARLTKLINFGLLGLLLGFVGFWATPLLLDSIVGYDREIFGPGLFLFMFWVFINVHHYFLDNVIWRKENPDMQKYLFARA